MKYMDFNGLDSTFDVDPIYFGSYAHQTFLVSMSHPSFTQKLIYITSKVLILENIFLFLLLDNKKKWWHMIMGAQKVKVFESSSNNILYIFRFKILKKLTERKFNYLNFLKI